MDDIEQEHRQCGGKQTEGWVGITITLAAIPRSRVYTAHIYTSIES